MKPGYKTSEFWLSLIAMVIGTLFASGAISDGGWLDKVLGMAATVLGQLGYAVPRTLAKGKLPRGENTLAPPA